MKRARFLSDCSVMPDNLACFLKKLAKTAPKLSGNYPQAFTHIALINSAYNLKKAEMRQAEHHTDPVVAAIHLHK